MTDARDHSRQYGTDSVIMARDFTLVERLRAALEAAEELEEDGIAWEEAWRSDEDWLRVGRIRLLLATVEIWLASAMSAKREAAWRERTLKRQSIHRVK